MRTFQRSTMRPNTLLRARCKPNLNPRPRLRPLPCRQRRRRSLPLVYKQTLNLSRFFELPQASKFKPTLLSQSEDQKWMLNVNHLDHLLQSTRTRLPHPRQLFFLPLPRVDTLSLTYPHLIHKSLPPLSLSRRCKSGTTVSNFLLVGSPPVFPRTLLRNGDPSKPNLASSAQ